ncbi:MAG TPA: hypothetical protein VMM12_03035 [Longimicrobiales bacterium]|nr:hypothetical protein [Longimicrobiales bacterium]
MAGEVDRLLRQLRPPEERVPRPATTPRPRPATARRPAPLPTPRGVWARVALVTVLAIGLTQWPYAICGFPLAGYLAAVVVALVAGVWAGHAAWRTRMGLAHIVAIILLFAGAALGARQVLPRLGYAPVETAWRCPG